MNLSCLIPYIYVGTDEDIEVSTIHDKTLLLLLH